VPEIEDQFSGIRRGIALSTPVERAGEGGCCVQGVLMQVGKQERRETSDACRMCMKTMGLDIGCIWSVDMTELPGPAGCRPNRCQTYDFAYYCIALFRPLLLTLVAFLRSSFSRPHELLPRLSASCTHILAAPYAPRSFEIVLCFPTNSLNPAHFVMGIGTHE